jgi:hypothetical protein
MENSSIIVAYQMALKQKQPHVSTIHHSDRELQYYSQQYVALSENTAGGLV